MVSGSSSGHVYGWNTSAAGKEKALHSRDSDGSEALEPILYHRAHSDAVNGIR